MKAYRSFPAIFFLVLSMAMSSVAAEFYVATNGNDGSSGSSDMPWLTIQKAANTVLPGDTVIVRSGNYNERVVTARAGTGELNRITFQAEDTVIMKGWRINHAYVTINGFEITGWSAASFASGHVEVTSAGDHFEMFNCTVRDGIQITRPDMIFNSGVNTITSATGGFLDAGFAPGQTMYVGAATNGLSIANSGTRIITHVTDTAITVATPLADDGPLFIYLSASYVYGLNLGTTAENCVIRGNTFRNLGFDIWFIMGNGHLLEDNVIEQVNGWDAMHFGGSNHIFRRNLIHNSSLLVYQNSPDALENFPSVPYSNVTFTNNFIQNFAGVLAAQKGQNSSSGLTLTRNVFVDVGRFSSTHPGTTIEQNTFLRVSRRSYPVVSRASHPVLINTSVGATNAILRNNLFVDCGEPSNNQTEADVGWYEISGSANSVVAEGNFVSGSPPVYAAKTGWTESNPLLNGGEPGFVNIDDPLGPDGIPFTDDDGLQLLATSKLINAGAGDKTPGAYGISSLSPILTVGLVEEHLRLSWPDDNQSWTLQIAEGVTDIWNDVTVSPVLDNGQFQVTLPATNSSGFFRLVR